MTVGLDHVGRRPVRRNLSVGDAGSLYRGLHARCPSLSPVTGGRALCDEHGAFGVDVTHASETHDGPGSVRSEPEQPQTRID